MKSGYPITHGTCPTPFDTAPGSFECLIETAAWFVKYGKYYPEVTFTLWAEFWGLPEDDLRGMVDTLKAAAENEG